MPFHQIDFKLERRWPIKFSYLKMNTALKNRGNFSQIPCLKPAKKSESKFCQNWGS